MIYLSYRTAAGGEHIRIFHTCLPITIDDVQPDYEKGECVSELSERGMRVRTRMPRQDKTLHAVLIRINDRVISLIARVLYRQASRDKLSPAPEMGLEFVQISPEDRQYIKQYVHEEVTKGIVRGERKDFLEETSPRRKAV
jgi:hypothetical protein